MKQTHICNYCGVSHWGWIGMVTCPHCLAPYGDEPALEPDIPFDFDQIEISENDLTSYVAQMQHEATERDETAAFDRLSTADEVRKWAYRQTGADEGLMFPDQADYVADRTVERWEEYRRAKAPKHPWFSGLTMLASPTFHQH